MVSVAGTATGTVRHGTPTAAQGPAAGAPQADVTPTPYKGLNSFQIEDGDLFYGRDREAEQLVAKILSSRLTVLHAQSGAGKTSLINARVIPGLEALGWGAVRVIPQFDPVRAVTTTTLLHLLPPPEAERQSIERAWERLDMPQSVGGLLQAFDRLPSSHPLRRRLAAPITVASQLEWTEGEIRTYPWFSRLLRSTLELEQFAHHLAAFRSLAGLPSVAAVEADTPVSDLVQMLTALNAVYTDVLESFDPRDRAFDRFFGGVAARYGTLVPQFSVVVLFDQAEELFTRFVHQPDRRRQTLDWRLKWEFFEQLERLVGRPPASDAMDAALPVRIVVSLRSEYIAQLDPIRGFAWDLDSCSYHLGMLGIAEATSAVTEPAGRFGYAYADECYTRIVGDLAREERYVEPAQLQIVCDKLWHVHGYLLADPEGTRAGDRPRITLATLDRLGGTHGILGSFLAEVLGALDTDDRLETLDMLELLVTRSGTRDVVSRDGLVSQRFRDAARRGALLDRLVKMRIVREEQRLGGLFCEITHEFLIPAVLTALAELQRDSEYSRFRWALATIQQLAETGQDARSAGILRISEFLAAHDHRSRLVLDDWIRLVMLRSALALAHTLPAYRDPRDVVAHWIREVQEHTVGAAGLDWILRLLEHTGYVLGLDELRLVNNGRKALVLDEVQLHNVFRSELARAAGGERDDLVYWTRRVAAHEQRSA